MQKTKLYRYAGVGGTIDSPILLDATHEVRLRISADEGMVLTDGEATVSVIDIPADELERWTEIPEPVEAEAPLEGDEPAEEAGEGV